MRNLRTARRGPSLQRAARMLLGAPVRRLWRLELSGYDEVPEHGPAILCPNHLSFIDSVFMMMTLDRPVYFIGKADYLGSWKTRRLFPAMGMIPIDRESGSKAVVGLDAAASVLGEGALLCVFPEGSRSRDGHLHRGYPGAARLAIRVGCPVLPVGIAGTERVQPRGARLPRPGRTCSITIGAPLDVAWDDESSTKFAARALTDQLMQRIAELSGQVYIARYTERSSADRRTAATSAPAPTTARARRIVFARFRSAPVADQWLALESP